MSRKYAEGRAIYRFLSDAALLVEARARLGLEQLITLMGWSNRRAYDTDVNRCLSGDRRYSPEQRAKLIEAIKRNPRLDEERERDAIATKLDEILTRLPGSVPSAPPPQGPDEPPGGVAPKGRRGPRLA